MSCNLGSLTLPSWQHIEKLMFASVAAAFLSSFHIVALQNLHLLSGYSSFSYDTHAPGMTGRGQDHAA